MADTAPVDSGKMAEIEASLSAVDEQQRAMMEERVIVTDYFDNPLGSGSKKETHIWRNIQQGMVHRAFSVFLFTPEGRLILQQRAATKVTFAEIWANTCCSHPLAIESESAMAGAQGVLNAARRKLEQELGISPEQVPLESFTWLTRVHYVGASNGSSSSSSVSSASSSSSSGSSSSISSSSSSCGNSSSTSSSGSTSSASGSGSSSGEGAGGAAAAPAEPLWGEHEIDWILVCTPPRAPTLAPNPNEVQAVRDFSQGELREWLRAGSGCALRPLVTPWFAVMERSGLLYRWWDAVLGKGGLEGVMERHVIYRQPELEALALGAGGGAVAEPPALAACRAATAALGVTGPKVVL